MKINYQSQLQECEDEGRRRDLGRWIRKQDEGIERLKQELETFPTDDDDNNDRDGEEGSVNYLCEGVQLLST